MIIFLAGLRQIPQDLYEAASWTAPAGAAVLQDHAAAADAGHLLQLVVQTIDAFKAFTPAFIITGGTGGPVDSTLFYTLYLYQQAFSNFRMGYASAMAWILVVIIASSRRSPS